MKGGIGLRLKIIANTPLMATRLFLSPELRRRIWTNPNVHCLVYSAEEFRVADIFVRSYETRPQRWTSSVVYIGKVEGGPMIESKSQ